MFGAKKTIVVIEDDPVYSQLITRFLKGNLNCEIKAFEDAVSCVHSKGLKPDIVFIDLVLKDLDGRSLAKILRKKWRSSVIVVMSSNEKVLTLNKSIFGIDRTVSKSSSVKEIIRVAIRAYQMRIFKRVFLFLMMVLLIIYTIAIMSQVFS
jgi:DNA-binding NarL/FixJ family response regulator